MVNRRDQFITRADPTVWGLPPDAVEEGERRSPWAKVFQRRDRPERTFIIQRGSHYLDTDGQLVEVDIRVFNRAGVFVADQGPCATVFGPAGITVLDRVSRAGLRWLTPAAPAVEERGATITGWQGLDWRWDLTYSGIKLRSLPVPAPLGPKTYRFPYQVVDAALAAQADGSLAVGGFTVPRAVVIGADTLRYPCGPWIDLPLGRIGFAFDDSALPASAFPYVIDPTTTFNTAANSDDGVVFSSDTVWPPVSSVSADTTIMYSQKSYFAPNYFLRTGLVRWDSSALDDVETISSASFKFYLNGRANADSPDFIAEYYASSNWPIDTGDQTTTVGTTAHSGTSFLSISTLNQYYTFSLNSPDSNINKTGYTGLRHGVTNITPSGNNSLQWNDHDSGSNRPQLVVVTPNIPPGLNGAQHMNLSLLAGASVIGRY